MITKRSAIWGLLVLLLLVLATAWAVHHLRGPKVEVVRVLRRDLLQRVVATGRVLPPARINLGSLQTSAVIAVRAESGTRVKAGQVLVELDAALEEAAVAQAEAGVAQARARLDLVRRVSARVSRETVRQAEAEMRRAEQKQTRVSRLHGEGVTPKADLDEANEQLTMARSRAQSALIQADSRSEIQLAQAALAQARAALSSAQARLAQTRIASPVAGTVLSRLVEPGDLVSTGQTLLILSADGPTRLVFYPEEKNLATLAVGQPAKAAADAFPEKPFNARVARIAPGVDAQRGTVEVTLDVPEPPPFLRPDMTISINVEVGRVTAALVVPRAALHEQAATRPYVLRLREGRIEKAPVVLGLRGDALVEVKAGLKEGDLATLAPEGQLKPGQRARSGSVSELPDVL